MIEASIAVCELDDVLRHEAFATIAGGEGDGALTLELRESIEQAILAGSLDLEQACGRWFRYREDWTETLDVDDGQRVFPLHAYPVTEIVSVTYAESGDFTGVDPMPATKYTLLRSGRLGELTLRPTASWLCASPAALRVVYKGGLAALVHQLPANLREGLVDQIAFSWKRSQNIEVSSIVQERGAITYQRNGSGTPKFGRAVSRYRGRIF